MCFLAENHIVCVCYCYRLEDVFDIIIKIMLMIYFNGWLCIVILKILNQKPFLSFLLNIIALMKFYYLLTKFSKILWSEKGRLALRIVKSYATEWLIRAKLRFLLQNTVLLQITLILMVRILTALQN